MSTSHWLQQETSLISLKIRSINSLRVLISNMYPNLPIYNDQGYGYGWWADETGNILSKIAPLKIKCLDLTMTLSRVIKKRRKKKEENK